MPRRRRGPFGPVIDDPRPSRAGGRCVIIGMKEDSLMTETFAPTTNLPGAFVPVDPHLELLLAINLLDEEPESRSWDLEPPRFHHSASKADERIPVLAG